MLGDCVGERLTLIVVLRYGSPKLLTVPSPCCSVFFQKNGSLGEFYSLFMLDRFETVKNVAYGEDYRFRFFGGTCLAL